MTRPASGRISCRGRLAPTVGKPMAFNPNTGLVYIPAQEIPMSYESVKNFEPLPMGWNIATATTNLPNVKGYLIAWDPVRQKEVWRANYRGPWNGGILTSAGNLVVQGSAAGDISAYRADSGEKLWSMFAQSPVMAAPITYEVDGEQYIAVLSGWGGAYPLLQGQQSLKSGNDAQYQPGAGIQARRESRSAGSSAGTETGHRSASRHREPGHGSCGRGVVRSVLQRLPWRSRCGWRRDPGSSRFPLHRRGRLVQCRARRCVEEGGMAPFGPVLDRAKATAIRDYIIHRANEPTRRAAPGTRTGPILNREHSLLRKVPLRAPRLARNAMRSPVARMAAAHSRA